MAASVASHAAPLSDLQERGIIDTVTNEHNFRTGFVLHCSRSNFSSGAVRHGFIITSLGVAIALAENHQSDDRL
jgi:hypothetical protein